MKRRNWTRALSFLLVICLLLGMMPSAFAGSAAGQNVAFEEVLPDENTADLAMETGKPTQPSEEEPAEDEMVRVSIVLEEPSVLEQGYEISSVNSNTAAQSYRKTLETEQQAIQAKISQAVQGKLKVAWNLTLVTNVISADIRYGDLEKVEATPGVSRVVLENRYDPCETETDTVSPNMGSATNMTGSGLAWLAGYTGAGSRIAIIDTGLDTDHQSVDNGAYLYALAENAKAANMTEEEYMTSLNMLTPEEIANVLPQLNVYKNSQSGDGTQQEGEPLTGEALYATEKIAFAYNYIDRDLDVTHDNDNQGGHGSHVAGIAAANRYIPAGDSYSPAAETVPGDWCCAGCTAAGDEGLW
ncbi:MAG: S8 family serine peptidase [Oscillospiraceae bacterium]